MKTMKKPLIMIVIAALTLILVIPSIAFAAGFQGRCGVAAGIGQCVGAKVQACLLRNGGNFVDADGDGICDNQGIGQGTGRGQGQGAGKGFGRR